jgi:hypothetical protein
MVVEAGRKAIQGVDRRRQHCRAQRAPSRQGAWFDIGDAKTENKENPR